MSQTPNQQGPLPGIPPIPGMPNIPGMPQMPGGPRTPRPKPNPAPQPPRQSTPNLPPPPKISSAYPGSITYIDLIAKNKRSSAILIVIMVGLLVLVGAAITGSFAVGDPNILWKAALTGGGVALIVGLLGTLISYYAGASAILAIAGAKQIDQSADPELFNVVDEVRIAAGLPMPKVYLIADTALNAFATGRDPQHAAVAITTGLRQALTRDELQGVMAHEMAHVRHYDIRFSMLMATMAGLIAFVCDAFLRIAWAIFRSAGRSNDKNKGAALGVGLVVMLVALVLYIFAPIAAFFVQMAFSRQREYLADAGAVELTRNPEGLISALAKLAGDRDPLVDVANRGTAHLYIVNPLRKMRLSGQELDSHFSSHPPIHKRIERLQALLR